ncbi:CHAT domain-containing protein [Saccharothrix sp. AJ9571]|nr:CHAT domain-containing protein [Saccharothrix sp. AJ9571]
MTVDGTWFTASPLDDTDSERLPLIVTILSGVPTPRSPRQCKKMAVAGVHAWHAYRQTDREEDLRLALYNLAASLPGLPNRHWARKDALSSFAGALRRAYELQLSSPFSSKTDRLTIADDLVATCREMLERLRPRHRDRGWWTAELAEALLWRYDCTGERRNLDEIIELRAGVDAAVPLRHPKRLACLASALDSRAADGDSDQAVEVRRQHVQATSGPKRAAALEGLATSLGLRALRTHNLNDFDEAISGFRAITPTGPRTVLDRRCLAWLLEERCMLTGEIADRDEAIELCRGSLTTPGTSDARRREGEDMLGRLLMARFAAQQRIADLHEGFDLRLRALPDHHPDRRLDREIGREAFLAPLIAWGEFMNDLARPGDLRTDTPPRLELDPRVVAPLRERFAMVTRLLPPGSPLAVEALYFEAVLACNSGERMDFDDVLGKFGRVADLIDSNDPMHAVVSRQWSAVQLSRYEHFRDERDLSEAVTRLRTQLSDATRPRSARSAAGMSASEWLVRYQHWNDASDVLAETVELVSGWAAEAVSRQAREQWLRHSGEVTRLATAVALQAGNPGKAAVLAERGRAVLLSRALDHGDDVAAVREHAPELAAEFERLGGLLREDAPAGRDAGAHRRKLHAEFEKVVAGIRALPEHRDFGAPLELADLRAQSVNGPVVVLNTSPIRSDALIYASGDLDVLPFPGTTTEVLAEQAGKLLRAVETSSGRWATGDEAAQRSAQEQITDVLGWLWDTITQPVLDHLGFTGPPAGRAWPRLWWIPTGPLGFLPVHAAQRDHHGALDRVISSYTPTIKALRRARGSTGTGRGRSALTVAMPTTPSGDHPINPLPSAAREAALAGEHSTAHLALTAEQATRAKVLAQLPHHERVHFACHSMADWQDPSAGKLLLHDHETNPLTVADVANSRFASGVELAVLSACGTAKPDRRFLDEAIQFTSAFHAAGFPHVIGTLWEIRDPVPVDLTAAFYRGLTRNLSHAEALHHATRELRQRYEPFPSLWAAHLHTGP